MSCSITLTGVALDCGNVGGLKKLYIAPVEDVSGTPTAASGEVTAITMASGKLFKSYKFRKGNANFVSTLTKDEKAGTAFISTDVTIQLNQMTKALRNEMVQLTKGNFYAIALDNNNIYHFIGYDSYTSATTGTGQTGAEMGEGNFYSLVLQAQTSEYPHTVASGIIAAIVDETVA